MKTTLALAAFLLVASSAPFSVAFTSPTVTRSLTVSTQSPSLASSSSSPSALFLSDKKEEAAASGAVFLPPEVSATEDDDEENEEEDDDVLEKVEKLGKGAAKAKRGKRKSGKGTPSAAKKSAASLAPEEVFYEGPPAITETIAPTVSILTVVGIIPAAAAWARQAWVRYKITSRRIRVTSGVGGKDMAEIVYPDIVEIRTVKRLFGDGDMVAFLRDGAKFEMRNIPNFDEAIEFMLKYMDKEVVDRYRLKGDVTRPE